MAQRWLAQSSDTLPARVAIARLALARGASDEAYAALAPEEARLIGEAEAFPARLELYALVLANTGQPDEAYDILMARTSSGDAWVDMFIRVASDMDAEPETVRTWLREGETLAGQRLPAIGALAQGWANLGADTGAEADYREIIRLLDGRPGIERSAAVILLAISHEQVGELDAAEERYRQAYALVPNQPIVLNNLAYLLLKKGQDIEEAAGYARSAVDGARQLGYPADAQAGFQHTLGEVLSALGRGGDSEQAFRDGLTLDPQHPHLLLSLAELLAEDQRREEAVSLLGRIDTADQSVTSDPDFGDRYDALKQALSQADPDS